MTIVTITTDIHIGPYIIPSNAQNMIMNNYANRNNLSVGLVIPEPMKSNHLSTLQWIKNKRKIDKVILCSIYQIPRKKIISSEFISKMKSVEFHFAIEGVFGKGEKFLWDTIKEAKIFEKAKKIDSQKLSWMALSKISKK